MRKWALIHLSEWAIKNTVYIGTKANSFTDYPMIYDGDLTLEKLIQGIADLTGWNLTLAEDVISGKGERVPLQ